MSLLPSGLCVARRWLCHRSEHTPLSRSLQIQAGPQSSSRAPRCHAEIVQCSRRAVEIATPPAHGSRAPQTLATGRASEIAQAPPGAPYTTDYGSRDAQTSPSTPSSTASST